MIFIKNILVSQEILEKKFMCDLKSCKGACCVEGNAGAPLEKGEIKKIKNSFEKIKKNLNTRSIKEIKRQGFYVTSEKGNLETPLNNGKECVYAIKERNGQIKCAFEKSFFAGESNFRKPISCHLYPIRIKKTNLFEKLNYEHWDICSKACKLGDKLKIPVYVFLKDALISKYGKSWYKQLCSKIKSISF